MIITTEIHSNDIYVSYKPILSKNTYTEILLREMELE